MPQNTTLLFAALWLALSLIFGSGRILAQDAQPSPTPDPDVVRLNAAKEKAELLEAIAKAKKAELEARFPPSDAKTLDGKTTIADTGRVEEQVAGYVSVGEAANRIGEVIRRSYPGAKMIAIYNEADIQLLLVYSATTKRLDIYKTRYDKQVIVEEAAINANGMWIVPNAPCDEKAVRGLGGAPFNPLGVATSVLGSFSDILAFFRTDVDIKGTTFAVREPIIVTEVFRVLRAKYSGQIELYYPQEFPPILDSADSDMLDRIESLFDSKAKADALFNQIGQMIADKKKQKDTLGQCIAFVGQTRAKLQKPINDQQRIVDDLKGKLELSTDPKDIKELPAQITVAEQKLKQLKAKIEPDIAALEPIQKRHEDDIRRLDKEIAALEAAGRPLATLNSQTELLFKDLIKVDEKTGISQLTAFIRSERIQKLMANRGGYWLKLNVVIAGGNTKVKRNLIVDVFTGGSRVSYSGASIVEYHLYDRFGRSLLSDTTSGYIDYKKAKDIKKFVDDSRLAGDQQ
jgi:phage shock protein A